MTETWRPYIVGSDGQISRRFWELCLLSALRETTSRTMMFDGEDPARGSRAVTAQAQRPALYARKAPSEP